MDALISAQAGIALLIQGSELVSIHADSPDRAVPRLAEEAHLLFGEAQDLQVLEGVDRDQIVRRLRHEADSAEALQLSLILLDSDLSEEIRSEAAEELDGLLAEKECREGLERVLFAHPLPQEADLPGALTHSRNTSRVQDLLRQLADLQPSIEEAYRAWMFLPDTLFESPADRRRFRVALVRGGLFRGLVLVRRAGNPVESFLVNALLKLPQYRAAIQAWAVPFRRHAPHVQRQELAALQEADNSATPRQRRRLSRDRKAALERVEIQKKAIISAMSANDLDRVRDYVSDLVEYQLVHEGAQYAAKSLCDLAMKAKELDLLALQLQLTERSVQVKPDDGWAWAQYGNALLASGSHDAALDAFANTISFGQAAVGQIGQAEAMRSLGHFDEALESYNAVVERFPDNAFAKTGRAETLRDLGRFDEALESYDAVIERFSNNTVARNGRAETLRDLGRFEEALDAYNDIIEHFPDDVVPRNGRAETLRDLGHLDEALEGYDAVVERFPNDVYAKTGRAETLRALGRFDEALESYDAVIERFPNNAVARTGRAETLRDLGRFDLALEAYDAVIERFPSNAVARNGRAETFRDLGRFDLALESYDAVIERFPNDAVARSGHAETLRSLGRLDDALAAYNATITQFPHNLVARNGRAGVLVCLGRWEEALETLPVESPAHFEDWIGYHIRGIALLRLGRLEEAERIFRDGIEKNPMPAQRDYFRSAMATLKVRRREYSGASAVLETVETSAFKPQVDLLQLHSFGAQGEQAKAIAAEHRLQEERASAEFHEVREELKRRYIDHLPTAHSEEWLLDREVALLVVTVAASMLLRRRAR